MARDARFNIVILPVAAVAASDLRAATRCTTRPSHREPRCR